MINADCSDLDLETQEQKLEHENDKFEFAKIKKNSLCK